MKHNESMLMMIMIMNMIMIMTMFRLNRELSTSLQLIEGLRGEVEQKENIAKMAVDSNTVSENLQIFPSFFCGFSVNIILITIILLYVLYGTETSIWMSFIKRSTLCNFQGTSY